MNSHSTRDSGQVDALVFSLFTAVFWLQGRDLLVAPSRLLMVHSLARPALV